MSPLRGKCLPCDSSIVKEISSQPSLKILSLFSVDFVVTRRLLLFCELPTASRGCLRLFISFLVFLFFFPNCKSRFPADLGPLIFSSIWRRDNENPTDTKFLCLQPTLGVACNDECFQDTLTGFLEL